MKPRYPRAAWPQAVAVLVGVLFAIVGVTGFAATGVDHFAAHGGPDRLFGLGLNPLQNLVHLAFGIAGIVLSARLPRARLYGWLLAAGMGALFGYGVLGTRLPQVDVLNPNWPTNWWHLAFALVGLLIALGPVRTRAPADDAPAEARPAAPRPRQGRLTHRR